jgi:hypothetical protein
MTSIAVMFSAAFVVPLLVAQAPKAEYDPAAETTVRGTVDAIHESKIASDHPGLHLVLKTEEGQTVEVHACPVRFLTDLEISIEKGDRLTVVGARSAGEEAIVAREIKRGTTTVILRDAKGAPVWRR